MPIQVQTKPGGQLYAFNESRLQKVMESSSLQEAQRMGFWDKLSDTIFHGSAKQEAIRELYTSVVDPSPDRAAPVDMVSRFLRLRDLAPEDQRHQFTTLHSRPSDSGSWAYALKVGDIVIYRSPHDLTDKPQTSFDAFHDELLCDVVVQETRALAKLQQTEADWLLQGGGYVDVDDVIELRDRFSEQLNQAVNEFDSARQPRLDTLQKLLSLQHTRPLQAHQAFEALEQVRLGNGTTNLMQVLLGAQGPSPTVRGMSGLLTEVMKGSKDALDLTVQAHQFGETLMRELPPNSSPEAAHAQLLGEFRKWSAGLSDVELTDLYRAYTDKLELTVLQQLVLETNFAAGDKAPLGEDEKPFMDAYMQRLKPFKWGLDALGQLFDAVKG